MQSRLAKFILIFISCLSACPSPGSSQTVLESFIASQNPCDGLKFRAGFLSGGINYLKEVRLPKVTISLTGDELSIAANGTLACRTSDKGVVKGDASAQIELEIVADLSKCSIQTLRVRLGNFGGTFGEAISAFSDQIEQTIANEVRKAAVNSCEDISNASIGARQ
ncbi:hypothetical protein [Roseibium sp. SCP14]|uniref:hypothetical protein n=1 Tax=Roseibium sp. SCP14 TaxID=3141375 RepID=UPI00333B7BE6